MHIEKLIVKNYRVLRDFQVEFNEHLNILVGNNETGKSTALEAINLALCGQLNGRSINYELHPHLLNTGVVDEYLRELKSGNFPFPPSILIELYLSDDDRLASLKGTNNSLKSDCSGVSLTIELDDALSAEYEAYIKTDQEIKTVPIEYYTPVWRSFADAGLTVRSVPLKATFIDASTIRNYSSANRFLLDIVRNTLAKEQQVALAQSYRTMRDSFLEIEAVKAINNELASKGHEISDKTLSVAFDSSSRAGWESTLTPELNDVPLTLIGKGEQNSIKVKLAMRTTDDAHVCLIEEPENHLSYSSLNMLISKIARQSNGRQLIISTHNSFVLNKLGIDNTLLMSEGHCAKLSQLSIETRDYFMKLPGHDTLRLLLCRKAVLVEGPSDELIVQKAYLKANSCMPLDNGVDIISVRSLAFKRFLEIAKLLDLKVIVVTDNDGDIAKLKARYVTYLQYISFDEDVTVPTLEPQMVRANGLELLNQVLGKSYATADELIKYMLREKTETALKIFETQLDLKFPEYIMKAVRE